MRMLTALLFAGLLLHVVHSDDLQCSAGPAVCHEERMTEAITSQARFPSEVFLDTHCDLFIQTISCLVSEAEGCENSPNKDVLSEYKAIKSVVDAICEKGSSFRTTYLKHVPCYNQHLQNFRNCKTTIKEQVDGFKESGGGSIQSIELLSPFKYICLKMFLEPNCQITETAKECGMEAASPVRDILYGASNLLISSLCKEEQVAIWWDEFRRYLVESRLQQQTAVTKCVTESIEIRPTIPYAATPPPGIPGTPPPNIRDAVLRIVKARKGKLNKQEQNTGH